MEKTIAERQRDIAVEALRKLTPGDNPFSEHDWRGQCALKALSEIAALDAPPQPDPGSSPGQALAEIGATAYVGSLQQHRPPLPWATIEAGCNYTALLVAYAAMRAAEQALAKHRPDYREIKNADYPQRLENPSRGF